MRKLILIVKKNWFEKKSYFLLTIPLICCCFLISCDTDNPINTAGAEELFKNYDANFVSCLNSANAKVGKNVLIYEKMGQDLLPRKIKISCSHFELGYLFGLITKYYYNDTWQVTRNEQNKAINQGIINMYQTIYPEYLEFAKGYANAMDLTLDDIDLRVLEHMILSNLWWNIFHYQDFVNQTGFSKKSYNNCSIISYYLENEQRHLIGRNFDNLSVRPHFVVETNMEGVYKVLGNTCYMLYNWVEDGINEKGLFAGVVTNGHPAKYNYSENYPNTPSVQVIHMVRIILEKCSTVEEALNIINSVRIWFPIEANHLLIADALGNSAVVEFDLNRNMTAFKRKEPYLILTNTAYLEGIDYIRENCWRYRTAESRLTSGINNIDEMFDVISSIQPKSDGVRTLWTSLFDLTDLKMDVRFRSESYETSHIFNIK